MGKHERFWSVPPERLFGELQSSPDGISSNEAGRRLLRFGSNALLQHRKRNPFLLFFSQFKSPIILLLIAAALLSIFLGDVTDSVLILVIVIGSGVLGFWQEHGAQNAVEKLLALVLVKATVLRDGKEQEVPVKTVVPGDVVVLAAGEIIPGDGVLVEARSLFIDQSTLTGESMPVEKQVGAVKPDATLAERTGAVFMGTHVASGRGKMLVARTGRSTEFGRISGLLGKKPPVTEFEKGIRRFGYFLMLMTVVFVTGIFLFNMYFRRPVLDSLLFSLTLAVGFTPQLLPAIISVNLSRGARRMAEKQVIVKRLPSIENFGSMNILCSDKTGTLTEGTVQLRSSISVDGNPSERVLRFAYINAFYETGYANPIDRAIRESRQFDMGPYRKLDEIPYDFERKRLSVSVAVDGKALLVTKGAFSHVLPLCSGAERPGGEVVPMGSMRGEIERLYEDLGAQGFRVLAVAIRFMETGEDITVADERDMTFLGFIVILDPLKKDIERTLERMAGLGISLKLLTGDNALIAASVSRRLRLTDAEVLTGGDIDRLDDEALTAKTGTVDVFAEVDPEQKQRVIAAFRRAGNVVGYLGDGINDTPAFHAADVSISVNSAVDVAKEEAGIILMEKDLGVLIDGVLEGRRTFANTMKYIFIATSANFGNMFSMAGASLLLPFLPALPKQILLTNLMTDLPALAMAADNVDPEIVGKPRRWDLRFIRRFMVTFGVLSSVFDYCTFAVLLFVLHAGPVPFRAGWFIESTVSSALIVLVVRTRRRFFRSRPGTALLAATLVDVVVVLLLPFTFVGLLFGIVPLPPVFLLYLAVIVLLFFLSAEAVKEHFYSRLLKTGREI